MEMHIFTGILHLCGMVLKTIYAFIIGKNILLDKLYMISFVLIPFSWVIFKDECIISYITKKIENPNYILGSEPQNVKDITDLFANEQQYLNVYNIMNALYIGSLFIVNSRTTKIPYSIFIPTCLLFLLYNYDIMYQLDFRKQYYPYFQIILSSYLFATFLYTIGILTT